MKARLDSLSLQLRKPPSTMTTAATSNFYSIVAGVGAGTGLRA
jgi:hypothetical protein